MTCEVFRRRTSGLLMLTVPMWPVRAVMPRWMVLSTVCVTVLLCVPVSSIVLLVAIVLLLSVSLMRLWVSRSVVWLCLVVLVSAMSKFRGAWAIEWQPTLPLCSSACVLLISCLSTPLPVVCRLILTRKRMLFRRLRLSVTVRVLTVASYFGMADVRPSVMAQPLLRVL